MTNSYDTPTVKMTCSTCLGYGLTMLGRPISAGEAAIYKTICSGMDLATINDPPWYQVCPECDGYPIKGLAQRGAPKMIALKSGIEIDSRMFDMPLVNFLREQGPGEVRPDGQYTYTVQVMISDGTVLEAKGLGPDDSKEFHEHWSARRAEIKSGHR